MGKKKYKIENLQNVSTRSTPRPRPDSTSPKRRSLDYRYSYSNIGSGVTHGGTATYGKLRRKSHRYKYSDTSYSGTATDSRTRG